MMPTDHFAGKVAARYDKSTGPYFDPIAIEETVDFLQPLAHNGALELAKADAIPVVIGDRSPFTAESPKHVSVWEKT